MNRWIKLSAACMFCILFTLTLTVTDSQAQLPNVIFAGTDTVYIGVAPLGTIAGNEWRITGVIDWPGLSDPVGIGLCTYNPGYNDFVLLIGADAQYYAHAITGTWAGDGTAGYYAISTGDVGTWTLNQTPPSTAEAGSDSVSPIRR